MNTRQSACGNRMGQVVVGLICLLLIAGLATPVGAELVAHWTFDTDRHRDGVYPASSGKNRPATVTGTVTAVTVDAPLGRAVALSGGKAADYLTTPYFGDLSGPGKSFTPWRPGLRLAPASPASRIRFSATGTRTQRHCCSGQRGRRARALPDPQR